MILITGGTGLIGSHLILQLLAKNESLRLLYRSEDKKDRTLKFLEKQGMAIADLSSLEWVKGDILDIPVLNRAMTGIEMVYHCAALISFDSRAYRKLRKVNIEGTANVVNACIDHNIKKLCYVSSIATLGKSAGNGIISEKEAWNPQQNNNVYAITKYGAEMEVWRGSQEGLKCVIMNPGVVLGEGLWEQSTGKFFQAIEKGLNYYTSGGTGFVDVRDVARAMIKGAESPVENEKFILVGENATFKDLFSTIAKYRDKKPPSSPVPSWVLELLWRLDWVRANIFRLPRKLSKATARSSQEISLYDNHKAKEILGIQFTPLEESIQRISNWH